MTAAPTRLDSREELLQLLLNEAILRRTPEQPVLSRDGTSARWMLDSLPVTLSSHGASLCGRLILERLQRFEGRQLATFGLTAIPILQSVIMQSGGAYHGLIVRGERKPHGSRKLIEGRIDVNEPTILIDDSIASGTNMQQGIATLKAAGLRVEGCLALVRFGWEGGFSELQQEGYHTEAIYDIFTDFMARMEGEEKPDYNPTKHFEELRWSRRRASEHLHPAHLAREVIEEYIASGEVLLPPSRLDSPDYDARGGAWVSIRSRNDIFDRHARDGFWHFPGEASWGVPEDVVRAAFQTASALPEGNQKQLLDTSSLAVTLFSALEKVTVGELDNDRYGIVVVSAERPEIMGGALPRMPGIRDAWQQFHHARFNNAGISPFEPYVLYRHDVMKYVEPDATWPPSGVRLSDQSLNLGALAAWVHELATGAEPAGPFPILQLPATASQVFVTIYIGGEVRGCCGVPITDVQEDVRQATAEALHDDRFEDVLAEQPSDVAVSVSLLYNELEMGDFSREEVQSKYSHGQQALMLSQGSREGLLLPFVTSWLSLDAEDFVDEVIDKAGITRPPYNWRRFDCSTWLADAEGSWRLSGGFKHCAPSLIPSEIARLHVDYLLRNQRPDGSLYFGYYPFQNSLYQGIDVARQAHAAWTLARAGCREAAASALQCALNRHGGPGLDLTRDSFVLLTLCATVNAEERGRASAIAEALYASIGSHGQITTWKPDETAAGENSDQEPDEQFEAEDLQNYVPGQVLLALGMAGKVGLWCAEEDRIERAFRYYRHRFRYQRDFGQVSWITQAAAAWSQHTRNPEWARLAFEVTDWILEFQDVQRGGFLTDHQPDAPGYTTALYLEAVTAAAATAAIFEPNRVRRYTESWQHGFRFLDRLIIQPRDASVLPNADYAIGGLRENLYSSHVRIDFVQHSLAAILEHDSQILQPQPH